MSTASKPKPCQRPANKWTQIGVQFYLLKLPVPSSGCHRPAGRTDATARCPEPADDEIEPAYRGVPVLRKPFGEADLEDCLRAPAMGAMSAWGSLAVLSTGERPVRYAPESGLERSFGVGQLRAMCGRLRVGKENLHVAGLGRCGHVFGLLARFA
jgi:hypothetical protein